MRGSLSKHQWPLALPHEHRCQVGFALGLPVNLCEGCLQTPAVASHCPPASGVREVTQSSIHQRLTRACYPVELTEARGFEPCCPGHAVEFKFHSDTVLPLEVKKFINTNPFGHEKVASGPLQRGPATAGRRTKVGPRCGVRWPVEQGSLLRWWCLQNPHRSADY